jgi:beta-lactamase class D
VIALLLAANCFMLQPLDGAKPYVSDPVECAVKTLPASTFKIPHALIALETNVAKPRKWDGSKQPFPTWERDHTLDSAVKWSAFWYFQRTAAAIGRARMQKQLRSLGYASDTFERELTSFWVNGDLVVSPAEQLSFLRRMMRYELPVRRRNIDTVKAAFLMPRGAITNASGTHPFVLDWPADTVVRAKTGNGSVDGERVSWLIGHLESGGRQYVFVSRVRERGSLPGTAGADLARRMLNERR